ncbi:helix-turn-helix domain-containing protein [Halosimplex aquaticum]|uniref:Helix-turn-helix domain-containing protein n=1 Tax=Halosimplex aquaticum TaxID=3026162 RepID=A0ABD5Y346_9EURY|nr:helix-turn-helix domain-containing protein [Halosimplex aquaticum]
MRQATFETTYPEEAAHPFHRRMMEGGPVSRAELLIWGPTAEVTTLTWFDAAPSAVEDVLAAVESTTRTHLVAADGGTYAFVRQTDYELPDPVMDLVAASRVVFVPPLGFEDSGVVRFDAVGESDALGEFYADLADLFPTELRRVRAFRQWSAPAALTDRRREALEVAVAVGYYDVPRSGSVADVAAELDCSPSTAGELLRRAESTVLTAFVGGSDRAAPPSR